MALSALELQLGYSVFANQTRGNKCKQNMTPIFVRNAAFHACLSSHLDRSTYAPDKSQLM